MPTLTKTELTSFLNEDAAARAEARTLANIARRASSLFSDGYTMTEQAKDLFYVASPAGDAYIVRVSSDPAPFGPSCSCPCFESRKTCKHLLAVTAEVESTAAQVAEYEARQEAILNSDTDRYAEL